VSAPPASPRASAERAWLTALTLVASVLLILLALEGALARDALASPNVLMIVTDDQRTIGTMDISDPALDPMKKTKQWFAAQGTGFPEGSVTTPLCCPSRGSIFTGRYVHNHGVKLLTDAEVLGTTENELTPDGKPNPQRTTLQYYLQQRANPRYTTALFGKYLNGWNVNCTDGVPPTAPPFFDRYVLFNNSYSPVCVNDQGNEQWLWRYSTNYVSDKALDFLHTAPTDRPWFLYVAPFTPHFPFSPEPKYANAAVPPFTPNASFFETDRRDKPFFYRLIMNDTDTIEDTRVNQLKMLRSVDDMVDRILTELSSEPWPGHPGQSQADNTLAFFVSDNGYLWGEHGLVAKSNPYLDSVKVPFYIRWPGWAGHSGGQTDNRLVANVDLAPTVLDAVGGVTTSPPMDGQSLLDTTKKRNRLLTEYWQPYKGQSYMSWASIRTPTLHYVEHYNPPDWPAPAIKASEYYDLTNDPLELTNLLQDGNSKNDPPTGQLSSQLAADVSCTGQGCPPGAGDPSLLPVETGITVKPDPTSARDVTFRFTSTEPDSTFTCKLDGQSYRPCQSSTTYTRLSGGRHTLTVRAARPGGGGDTTPATHAWRVDNSLPDTSITGTPGESSTTRDAPFTFSSPNASTFDCTLDGGPTERCTSPKTYTGLADGSHTFSVRAVNTSTGRSDQYPASHAWSIDATPPDTAITCDTNPAGCIADGSASPSETATFTFFDPSDPNTLSTGRFECKLDSGNWTACGEFVPNSSPKKYTKTYTGLARGPHAFSVRAFDIAGNVDTSPDSRSWQIGPVQSFYTTPDVSWPAISSGREVRSVIPDGCGGWYVGGFFTHQVAGVDHFNLLHIKKDKTVDVGWNPSASGGTVRTMVLWQPDTRLSGTLYLGGMFTAVNGSTRRYLAAVTTPSCDGSVPGGVLAPWDPNADGFVYTLMPGMDEAGTDLEAIYAGGEFTQFTDATGGVRTRKKIAELTLKGSPVKGQPTAWDPNAQPDTSHVNTLAITANRVYAGGSFASIGGNSSRKYLAELDRSSGQATEWAPDPDNIVSALRLRAQYDPPPSPIAQPDVIATIYVGGYFTTIGSTPVARSQAAEINLADTGTATGWDPSLSRAAAWALLPLTDTDIVLGGGFDGVQGTPRSRLAETDRTAGAPYDWDPNLNMLVYSLNYSDPVLAVGGLFTTAGGINRGQIAFYCAITAVQPCAVTSP
jgi:arylsulfatase A-like enzyme